MISIQGSDDSFMLLIESILMHNLCCWYGKTYCFSDREQQTFSPKKENINDADCQGLKYGNGGVSITGEILLQK